MVTSSEKPHLIDSNEDITEYGCNNEKIRTQRHRAFIKTILTIFFAAILGICGIFIVSYEPTTSKSVLKCPNHAAPSQCTQVPINNRQDCWPHSEGVTPQKCEAKGCCWLPGNQTQNRPDGVPWCFFPENYETYMVTNLQTTPYGYFVKLQLAWSSGWPNDIKNLVLNVSYDAQYRLHFKFFDPSNQRYEVPVTLPGKVSKHVTHAQSDLDVNIPSQGAFYMIVTRKSTGTIIFSTQGASPLVFADQFLQLGTLLSSHFIYGLGEHRSSFLLSTAWTKMAFWSRDEPPSLNSNLYGVHPVYLNIEPDGNSHGVFLLNSNAMEIELQPAPALTYRTAGGILDFYIMSGLTADNVVQQYTELIGRPFMPPYWALGFHLCRWGYGGIDGLKRVIQRNRDAQMPYDTQWNDIDYMRSHLDWTYDSTGNFKGLPDVVQDLHDHGQHYIIIVDPGISNSQPAGSYSPYDDGLARGVFIMSSDGVFPIVGKVWPGNTVFPDFFHPNATDYWTHHAKAFHDQISYDGMWIDMNEPSNFVSGSILGCPDNDIENPPFVPPTLRGGTLRDRTLCATARQYLSSHYHLHSLYGHSEAVASKSALDNILGNRRSIVISRSTYPTTGVHAGHWLGDNNAQWIDTYYSITGVMNFQLFGIPFVGADICGFNGDTTPELCARWMQLGAFYPFMRNHNALESKDQDPASFDEATQKIMRDALQLRYTLLPYLYTLLYRSHVDGTLVVRPLFFQYSNSGDDLIYGYDAQFMWGTALLITPATSENTVQGQGYLPKDRWYDWFNHSFVDSSGQLIMFDLPMEHINLQVRGGSIIPLQTPNVTTTLSRKNKFSLLAALAMDGSATGELYWDDGESLDSISSMKYNQISFSLSQKMLSSQVLMSSYTVEPMTLGTVYILGVEIAPTSVTVNGQVITDNYTYINQTLTVYNLSVNLLQPLQISWLS